jgi:hypothetical protein
MAKVCGFDEGWAAKASAAEPLLELEMDATWIFQPL